MAASDRHQTRTEWEIHAFYFALRITVFAPKRSQKAVALPGAEIRLAVAGFGIMTRMVGDDLQTGSHTCFKRRDHGRSVGTIAATQTGLFLQQNGFRARPYGHTVLSVQRNIQQQPRTQGRQNIPSFHNVTFLSGLNRRSGGRLRKPAPNQGEPASSQTPGL